MIETIYRTVKSWKELQEISECNYDGGVLVPGGKDIEGDEFPCNFPSDMKKLCDTTIQISHWNGWSGFHDDGLNNWTITKPMLRSEMNRNGANKGE